MHLRCRLIVRWFRVYQLANLENIRYYTLTDLVPVHFAAIALNPEMKFKYFESEWESRADWIVNRKDAVRKLWESQYKPAPTTPQEERLRVAYYISASNSPAATTATTTSGSTVPGESSEASLTHIPDWQKRKRQRLMSDNCDDLDRYLRRDVEDELPFGPLKYWIDHADDMRQKDLSKMAIDIFSIPAMSADPERLFSRYVL